MANFYILRNCRHANFVGLTCVEEPMNPHGMSRGKLATPVSRTPVLSVVFTPVFHFLAILSALRLCQRLTVHPGEWTGFALFDRRALRYLLPIPLLINSCSKAFAGCSIQLSPVVASCKKSDWKFDDGPSCASTDQVRSCINILSGHKCLVSRLTCG